ncbi:hypothetical protein DFR24_3953 [Panacagrimonas perspica]|uniref:Uncharacterized protein n=1 Tax=Panacagrimonas perspica TaxID=381431 RepID=A0A4R7P1F1_9GAMM|nr:hypothetical protein DFR24_3953 [Panacagrimonas perspica]
MRTTATRSISIDRSHHTGHEGCRPGLTQEVHDEADDALVIIIGQGLPS